MGRKKKIKPNETESVQNNEETKGAFSSPENESVSNDGGIEQRSGANNEKVEKSIDEILSSFNTEQEKPPVEDSPSKDDFKPRKRGPKSKEIEPAKPILKVPGKLFLKIHSKVAVSAVSFLDRFIDKGNPIPEDYLHALGLSEEDLNDQDLITMAEMAIKEMKLEDNPITVFYISFGSLMLTNYMTLKQFLRAEAKKRREEFAAQLADGKKEMRKKRAR